jgi:hypothetical protein
MRADEIFKKWNLLENPQVTVGLPLKGLEMVHVGP